MATHKSIEPVKDSPSISKSNKTMINTFSISANDSLMEKEIKLIKEDNKYSDQTVKMNRSDYSVVNEIASNTKDKILPITPISSNTNPTNLQSSIDPNVMNRIINDDDKQPTVKEQLHLSQSDYKLIHDLEGGSPSPPPDPLINTNNNQTSSISTPSITNILSIKPPPVNPIVIPPNTYNNKDNDKESNTMSPATPCTPLKTVDPAMICRLFQFQEEDLVVTPHPVSVAASSRPNNEDTPHSTTSCPAKPNDYDIAARLLKFQHEDMEENNNINNSAPTLTNNSDNNAENNNETNNRRDLTVSATFKFTSRLNTVTISTPQPKESVVINDAEEPDNSMKRPLLITPFDPYYKPKSLIPISLTNNKDINGNNRKFVARSASGNFVLDDLAEAVDEGNNSTAFVIIPSSSSYVPKTSESGSRFETIDWNELDKRIEACPANISIIVHPNKSKRAVRPVKIAPENKENNAISNLLSTNTNSSVGHSLSSSHLHSYSQHNVLLRSSSAIHNSSTNNNRRMLTKNATDSELSSTHSYHKSRESSMSDTSNINPNSNSQVTSASTGTTNNGKSNDKSGGTGGNGVESTLSGSGSAGGGNNNNNVVNAIPSYLKTVSTSGNMTTYILDTSPDITSAPSSLSPQRYNGGNGIGRMTYNGSGTSTNGRINSYTLQPFKLKKSFQSGIYSNESPSLPLRIKKTWESVSPQLTPTNNFTSLNKVKPYSSSKLKKESHNDSITQPKPSPVQAYSHFSFSTKNNKVAPDNSYQPPLSPPPHP